MKGKAAAIGITAALAFTGSVAGTTTTAGAQTPTSVTALASTVHFSYRNWQHLNTRYVRNIAGVVFYPYGDKFKLYYNKDAIGPIELNWWYEDSTHPHFHTHRMYWNWRTNKPSTQWVDYNMREHRTIRFSLCDQWGHCGDGRLSRYRTT